MKTVVKVGGMSCMHCVAHVKEALLCLEGVSSVEVSLEKGTATIDSKEAIEEALIKKAIEDADYEYLGIIA